MSQTGVSDAMITLMPFEEDAALARFGRLDLLVLSRVAARVAEVVDEAGGLAKRWRDDGGCGRLGFRQGIAVDRVYFFGKTSAPEVFAVTRP